MVERGVDFDGGDLPTARAVGEGEREGEWRLQGRDDLSLLLGEFVEIGTGEIVDGDEEIVGEVVSEEGCGGEVVFGEFAGAGPVPDAVVTVEDAFMSGDTAEFPCACFECDYEADLSGEFATHGIGEDDCVFAGRQSAEGDGDGEIAFRVGAEDLGVGWGFLGGGVYEVEVANLEDSTFNERGGVVGLGVDGGPFGGFGGEEQGLEGGGILGLNGGEDAS